MIPPDTEIQLTADLSGGDMAAFDALYRRYHNPVYANIIKYVQRQDIAEDILQEVFLALWEHRHSFTGSNSIGGWLFVVSHNKSLSYLRKSLSEKRILSTLALTQVDEPADERALQSQDAILQDAINILSPAKKEVFRLCRVEGKSYKEAALLLNISPAQVKESLKSASKAIRNYLSEKYPSRQLIVLFLLFSQQG